MDFDIKPPAAVAPSSALATETGFSIQDAKNLASLVFGQERILDKKRRWLMGSFMTSTYQRNPKRLKKPKFLTNVYLPESYVRSDEVSYENVRNDIERSFGSFGESQETYHVVQDDLQLFDVNNMNSCSLNPSNGLKRFFSIINNLNNQALYLVASIVTDNKISTVKTRPRVKKIIKEYLPKVLGKSSSRDSLTSIQQIFRNPSNYQEKQLRLITPVNPSLISSINRMLEGLDEMPLQDLDAVNRKLRGASVVLQFPSVHSAVKRELLIKRVRKKLERTILALKEGDDLPKPLSKALSVMLLSCKQRIGCLDILTSEFFPFSPETISLQNDILKALWSLPKVKFEKLEALKPLVDPQCKVARKTFRMAIHKYLMGCLFECDEVVDVPAELQSALVFLNKTSRRRPIMFLKERTEDVEAVLNVSSHFKQVLQNLLPENSTDEPEGLGISDGSDCDDFELSTSNYCSNPGKDADRQINMSFINDEAEATGDSRPVLFSMFSSNGNCKTHSAVSRRGMIVNEPKIEQGANIILTHPFPEESMEQYPQNTDEEAESTRIQEICDEASLISYRLIGNMLDKFLQMEGRESDAMTRYKFKGSEDILHTSNEDTSSGILMQAVEEVLPSLPNRCIERVKELTRALPPTDLRVASVAGGWDGSRQRRRRARSGR